MAVQQKEEEEKKAKAAADAQNAQSQQTADQLGKFKNKIIKLTTAVKKFTKKKFPLTGIADCWNFLTRGPS